jgi:hypothetical protein
VYPKSTHAHPLAWGNNNKKDISKDSSLSFPKKNFSLNFF